MNRSQIECFLTLTDNSFHGENASEIFSQSALLQEIYALEREVGIALLDRTSNEVCLTGPGAVLRKAFQNMQDEYMQAVEHAKEMKKGVRGKLKVNFLKQWEGSRIFNNVGHFFQQEYPAVEFSHHFVNFRESFQELENNQTDIVLCNAFDQEIYGDLQVCGCWKIPISLFFSISHPMSIHEDVRIMDFKNESFFYPEGKENKKAVEDMGKFYGFTPKTVPVVNGEEAVRMVEACKGVGFFDHLSCIRTIPSLQSIRTDFFQRIVAVWHKDNENICIPYFVNEVCTLM